MKARKSESAIRHPKRFVKLPINDRYFQRADSRVSYLYMFLAQRHDRREIVHLKLTEHSPAQWSVQTIVEAFPFDTTLHGLLRDRDGVYGKPVQRRIEGEVIEQAITAP